MMLGLFLAILDAGIALALLAAAAAILIRLAPWTLDPIARWGAVKAAAWWLCCYADDRLAGHAETARRRAERRAAA